MLEGIDTSRQQKILFLDRDGVIIDDVGHISSVDDVVLLDGISDLINSAPSTGLSCCCGH